MSRRPTFPVRNGALVADLGATMFGDFGDEVTYAVEARYTDGATHTLNGLTREDVVDLVQHYTPNSPLAHHAIYTSDREWWLKPAPSFRDNVSVAQTGATTITIPPPQEEPMYEDIETLRQQAQATLGKLARAQALADRFPNEPPEFSVLRWIEAKGSGRAKKEYVYAALRAGENWYVTGERGNQVVSWEVLRRLIGVKPCELATGFSEIPAPARAAADEESDPAKWFELVYPNRALPAGATVDAEPVEPSAE